jgi:hypothetical protein
LDIDWNVAEAASLRLSSTAKDKTKASRAMRAMMGMEKLDLAKRQAALDGA